MNKLIVILYLSSILIYAVAQTTTSASTTTTTTTASKYKCLDGTNGCASCASTKDSCSSCKSGWYLDATSKQCKQCNTSSGCISCSDASKCTGVSSGYILLSDSAVKCPDGCAECTGKTSADVTCKTPAEGFWLKAAVAPATGFIPTACASGCRWCGDDTVAKCTEAKAGFFFDVGLGKCVTTNCRQCPDNRTVCKACNAGFFLDATKNCAACIANCAQCDKATECTACKTGFRYDATSKTCQACTPTNCDACTNEVATCSTCSTGYSWVAPSCIKCGANCNQCSVADQCNDGQCQLPYLLNKVTKQCGNTCSANCSCTTGMICCTTSGAGGCDSCASTYGPKTPGVDTSCQPCTSNCNSCTSSGAGKCDSGQCKTGFALDGTNCTECKSKMPGCSACTISSGTLSTCTDCFAGYTLSQGVCVNCNGGTSINSVATTGGFDPNAKSCIVSGTAVTIDQCKDGYFKYPATGTNKCYPCSSTFTLGATAISDTNSVTCSVQDPVGSITCNDGYYLDATSGQCTACVAGCKQCTLGTVAGCSTYLDNYGIFSEAASANPAIKACATDCKVCTKTDVAAGGVPGLAVTVTHCQTAVDGKGIFAEAAFSATGASNTNGAIKACFTNCLTCGKATVAAGGVGAYNPALLDCNTFVSGYGIAAEANKAGSWTNGAVKACPSNCVACAKENVAAGGVTAYTMALADCTTAATGYGFVGSAGAYTAILACPTNCATCAKASGTVTSLGVADCTAAASGYYLVGSAGAYTAITACNAGCATCTSSDACSTCKAGMALLVGTKFCFTVATTYVLDTLKYPNTSAASTFRRGIVSVTCKDGYSVINGICVSCQTGGLYLGAGTYTGGIANCKTCSASGLALTCNDCIAPYVKSGSSCVQCHANCQNLQCSSNGAGFCDNKLCKAGFGITSTNTCEACAPNCASCLNNGAGQCDSPCNTGFFMTATGNLCQTCTANCSDCSTSGGGNCDAGKCNAGYFKNGSVCSPCYSIDKCTCSSAATLIDCSPKDGWGKYFVGTTLTTTNSAITTISACVANCVLCFGPSVGECLQAAPKFYLDTSSIVACSAGCDACSGASADKCVTISAGFYSSKVNTTVSILPCPTGCAACSLTGTNVTCSQCPGDLGGAIKDTTVTTSFACTYNCIANCDKCTTQDNAGCSACKTGFKKDSSGACVSATASNTTNTTTTPTYGIYLSAIMSLLLAVILFF